MWLRCTAEQEETQLIYIHNKEMTAMAACLLSKWSCQAVRHWHLLHFAVPKYMCNKQTKHYYHLILPLALKDDNYNCHLTAKLIHVWHLVLSDLPRLWSPVERCWCCLKEPVTLGYVQWTLRSLWWHMTTGRPSIPRCLQMANIHRAAHPADTQHTFFTAWWCIWHSFPIWPIMCFVGR